MSKTIVLNTDNDDRAYLMEGIDPDAWAQKYGWSNYSILTLAQWRAHPLRAQGVRQNKDRELKEAIKVECRSRINAQSNFVDDKQALAVLAMVGASRLNATGTRIRDIAQYARQQIQWVDTASDAEKDAYDPATDPNWP